MRNKNIYCALPVEDLTDPEENSKTAALEELTKKRASRKKRQNKKSKEVNSNVDSANIDQLSELRISKMTENLDDKPSNFANITHKNVTGANNWINFLQKNKTLNGTKNVDDEFTISSDDEDSRARRKRANNIVAIDCEMVGIGDDGEDNMLARVSVVNSLGDCLYDTFVKPTQPVVDYRTHVSGVRSRDLVNAAEFSDVQSKVMKLLAGKILVGHAVYNDLAVLKIKHPYFKIRDTTHFHTFRELTCGTPSLKRLTSHFLNVHIQCGEHNSIQDAQATMQLYMLVRKEWEAELRKRHNAYLQRRFPNENHSKKKSRTLHKPKRFSKNYKK